MRYFISPGDSVFSVVPSDWRTSIELSDWLFSVARTERRVLRRTDLRAERPGVALEIKKE